MKPSFSSFVRASIAVLLVAAVSAPAVAQTGTLQTQSRYPVIGSDFESPFVAVAERLKPAVVYVEVLREERVRMPFQDLLPFFGPWQTPRQDQNKEPDVQKVPASGSGVIIDPSGLVLTNNHVVDKSTDITVTLLDGSKRKAKVVGTDPETDLALLDIGSVPADHVAPLGNSDSLQIGEWAIAMGNPFGLDWTLTVGVISAKGRTNLNIEGGGPTFQDFIQTDASINFGNSGGPLANIHGEVIGINAAINARAQNIGFAIPINLAKDVVNQLKESGTVRRGYLGMLPRELTEIMKEALNIDKDTDGVFVESVEPNTSAEEGGLKASDVITKVDGDAVSDVNDFRFRVARHAPGDKMSLTVLRDGKQKKLNFTLGDRADLIADSGQGSSEIQAPKSWMGLEVANLNDPRLGRVQFQVDEGVVVIDIENGSPAEGKLQPGDVIEEVDKTPVKNLGDWRKAVSKLADADRAVLVKFHPQGRRQTSFVALKK
ncbi:MAG: trypsin-like peptidase domain-containing protein [bacterium]